MKLLGRSLVVLGILGLLAFFGLTSMNPAVAERTPDEKVIASVREVTQPLRGRGNQPGPVFLSAANPQLDAISVLAGRAAAPTRMEASLNDEGLEIRFSRPVPTGRWVNIRWAIPSGDYANPTLATLPFDTHVGSVPVPGFIVRMLYSAGLARMRQRDPAFPDPFALVKRVHIAPDRLAANLVLPGNNSLFGTLANASGNDMDAGLTDRLYCALADQQKRHYSTDFDEHVRRVFSIPVQAQDGVTANRSRVAALALLVGGERAARVVVTRKNILQQCALTTGNPVKLQGRDDLAQHWAVSAALAAGLGGPISGTVGEWKELSDSLPHGSGFSFVDMAANRSGFRYGAALNNPQSADAVARTLATATAEQLVPTAMLEKPEALDAKDFRKKFQSVDSVRYQEILKQINARLTKAGVPQ